MEMDRLLRVGIVGTGGISQYHMMGYQALPQQVQVVACCDIDEEKAKLEKYTQMMEQVKERLAQLSK